MDAIKHMRKLDDMNHDCHLDPWILFHSCNNYELLSPLLCTYGKFHSSENIQHMHIKNQLYWYNFIQKIKFHWCESHVISWISWITIMAKCHFAFKFNPSNMCKFNWYILLLRFIFIHVSYFIMHGMKSHSFDNFPSFCFSFSCCPLFGELAKNIGNAPGGDGSLV
jgi:hypothetical protein